MVKDYCGGEEEF